MFVYHFAVYKTCYVFLCLTPWQGVGYGYLYFIQEETSSECLYDWPRVTKCQSQDSSPRLLNLMLFLARYLIEVIVRWMLSV